MELFLKENSSDIANALQILSEVLLISPHSERLMKMKAEVLFMVSSLSFNYFFTNSEKSVNHLFPYFIEI